MLDPIPGKPFVFAAPVGATATVVSLSHKAGANIPVFRYAGADLILVTINVAPNKHLPGVSFVVKAGRRRLSALAPFATNPPQGEFFFYERIKKGNTISLALLGSVIPDDPFIAWGIEA